MSPARAACIQMVSGESVEDNLAQAAALIAAAVADGAQLVALPENFAFLSLDEARKLAVAEADGQGPQQDFLAEQAARHGIWLLGGTVPVRAAGAGRRVHASSQLHDPTGRRVADYHKMHLFDVQLPGSAEAYRESAAIAPGDRIVVARCGELSVGLSVCYDLRFPELYRQLSAAGAELLFVPSAFTARTGAAHWAVLLRARAIENLAWVLAPNQGGRHACGRETWGHSMIVDPWGETQACLDQGAGFVCADIDRARQRQLRQEFPCLDHRIL